MYAPTGYGVHFVHVALMGDPTLRTEYINPPRNVVLTSAPKTGADISWTASADPAVAGYYVYRSDDRFGAYTKRSGLITGTSYTDSAGADGLKYYMVRAAKLETTPSGTYYNLSIGEVDSAYVYYPLSVAELAANTAAMTLYPNPASGTVHLSVPGTATAARIIILDVAGRTVQQETAQPGRGREILVDISGLASGIYHIVVHTGGKVYTQQLIKQSR